MLPHTKITNVGIKDSVLSLPPLSLNTLQRLRELSPLFEIRDRPIYSEEIISGHLSQAGQIISSR